MANGRLPVRKIKEILRLKYACGLSKREIAGSCNVARSTVVPCYVEPSESPISSPELARKYPLILTTGARIPEYTHTQFRSVSRLHQSAPEPLAEVHPDTARKYGIVDGDIIVVETVRGQIGIKAKTTTDLMLEVVSIPHGWV